MRRSSLGLFSLLLLAAIAPRAQANTVFGCPIVIDDFTQGPLSVTNGPFEFTQVGLPPQNCAGGSRHIVIDDIPTHMAGMVPLGGADIGYHIETSENGTGDVFDADVLLDYAMGQPMDLLAGGRNDRIQLDVVSVTDMNVFILLDVPGFGAGKTVVLLPGTNTLYLSTFSALIDLTQVTRIRFYFHEASATGVSELTLSRIRVTGNGGRYLYLDVPQLIEIGPPFPLPGPLMQAIYQDDGGDLIQTTSIGVSLESAILLPAGTGPFPTSMESSDSGPLRGGGLSAGFEFVEAASGKSSQSDGAFEFSLAMDAGGTHMPGRILLQETQDPDTAKTFHIPFDVEVLNAAGAPVGTHSMRLRVQVADAVPYEITNFRVLPPNPATNPRFGFSFEIHDDGTAPKLAEGQQLFDIGLEGDFLPYVAPTASPVVFSSGLVLSASPSVVSDRTILRMSRELDRATTVRIYDLAGRAVRTLPIAAGQRFSTWDTRDDAGRPVASGVYVARVSAGPQVAARKLVVVR